MVGQSRGLSGLWTCGGTWQKAWWVIALSERSTEDKTERGYLLESPGSRTNELERCLSPACVSLVRALLHSSLLLGVCTDTQVSDPPRPRRGERVASLGRRPSPKPHGGPCPRFQAVLDLMKHKPGDVKKFFWGHLEKDITYLAEALSRNMDDAMLTVHLFLQHLSTNGPGRETLGSFGRSRASWERLGFNWDRCYRFLFAGRVSIPGNR